MKTHPECGWYHRMCWSPDWSKGCKKDTVKHLHLCCPASGLAVKWVALFYHTVLLPWCSAIAHEANLPQPELSETRSPKKPLTFFAQSDEQNNRHTGKSKHLHWKDAKSPCWLVTETEGQASYCHKEGIHKIQVPYASVNKELWWNFQILKKPWTTKKVALN